jgi:hypothetical protein
VDGAAAAGPLRRFLGRIALELYRRRVLEQPLEATTDRLLLIVRGTAIEITTRHIAAPRPATGGFREDKAPLDVG